MAKCDMCYCRIENDMDPACVRVCTTKALKIGPVEEFSKNKAEHASISIIKSIV
jgi:Fe-S-cluster-containing dehydrogenase component